jgi:predicted DNA-binding transcriptional regulator YafY
MLLSVSRAPLPQQERLLYIDLSLRFLGHVARRNLTERFGVQTATATRDIATYRDERSANSEWVQSSQSYRRAAAFTPLFEQVTAADAFRWLAPSLGETGLLDPEVRLDVQHTPQTDVVRIDVLEGLTLAICGSSPLRIAHCCPRGGCQDKDIFPRAIADVAGRKIIRAFDIAAGRFDCVYLSEIVSVSPSARRALPNPAVSDSDWNTMVELRLVPHPVNVPHPEALLRARNLRKGQPLSLTIRRPMLEDWAERAGVDCTASHSRRGKHFQWWASNSH